MRNKYALMTQRKKQSKPTILENTRKPIKMNEIYCKRCLGGGDMGRGGGGG